MGVIGPQELAQPQYATFSVLQHFVVPEPNHPIPLGLDVGGAIGVGFRIVLATVDLDNDVQAMAGEIGNVVTQWNLKAESSLWEVLFEQVAHLLLGVCGVATQPPCADDGDWRRMLLHEASV